MFWGGGCFCTKVRVPHGGCFTVVCVVLDIKFVSVLARAGWRRMKLAPVARVGNRGSLVDEICYNPGHHFDSLSGAT